MPQIDFQNEELTEKERRNIDILEILRRRGLSPAQTFPEN